MSEFSKDQIAGKWSACNCLGIKLWRKTIKNSPRKFSAFRDAFELFDRSGEGMVEWTECANMARCFGYNPTNKYVLSKFFSRTYALYTKYMYKVLMLFVSWVKIVWRESVSKYLMHILGLLGGDEVENMTASQLREKRISLDDFLPHLWTISQAPDPGRVWQHIYNWLVRITKWLKISSNSYKGCYEEFYEGLKVFDKDGSGKVNWEKTAYIITIYDSFYISHISLGCVLRLWIGFRQRVASRFDRFGWEALWQGLRQAPRGSGGRRWQRQVRYLHQDHFVRQGGQRRIN